MLRNVISYRFLVAVLLPASLTYAGSLACPTPPGSGCTNGHGAATYTGGAFGASVNVLFLHTTISDTGNLPANGGSLSTQLASINLPGVLNAGLLTESTTGGANRTSSQSSVANVNLSAAGIGISASVLTSNATAQACGSDNPSVSGGSTIANLMVNGITVNVTGAPNQVVPLAVGSLIINEQTSSLSSSSCGANASIVVNALHLKVAGVADVIISQSKAGVTCSPAP